MKFSITDLVTFTEEIFNEKPHFLCSDLAVVYLIIVPVFDQSLIKVHGTNQFVLIRENSDQ